MADATVNVVNGQAVVQPFGADLIAPLLLAAQASADAAASSASSASSAVASVQSTIANIFTRAGYISPSTGNLVAAGAGSWNATELLDLETLDLRTFKLTANAGAASVAWYDKDKKFISAVNASSGYITSLGTVPTDAVYVAFSSNIANRANELFQYAIKPSSGIATSAAKLDAQAIIDKLFVLPGFYNPSGVYTAGGGFQATSLIEVAQLAVSRLKLYAHTNVASVAWFDENKAFISGSVGASIGSYITAMPSAPSGAYYVAFCLYTSDMVNQVFALRAVPGSPWRSDGAMALDMGPTITQSGYLSTTGAEVAGTGYGRSDFQKITAGEKLGYALYGHTVIASIAWYDSTKTFISAVVGTVNNGAISGTATAPAGAAYYRVSTGLAGNFGIPGGFVPKVTYKLQVDTFLRGLLASPSGGASAFSIPVFKRPKAKMLTSGSKVYLYGDSRSSTYYSFIASNYAAILGCTVTSGGYPGANVAYTADSTRIAGIFTADPEVIIYLPGGNDRGTAGSVGTFSSAIAGEPTVTPSDISVAYAGTYFIQAVDYTVRKILANYANIRTRAALTGSETETQKNDKIRAVKKPMLIVCTDLPQQRNSGSDTFSDPANWERKRQAIVEVCARNKVHCVDTLRDMTWDMSLEPFWTSSTDSTINNGVWTMDGLHPNEFGHYDMAQIVCADAGLI